MFDLFCFIMLRPPKKVDDRETIAAANDSELHDAPKRARAGGVGSGS